MTTSYCRHSTLSLQNGKRAAGFPFVQLLFSFPFLRRLSASHLQSSEGYADLQYLTPDLIVWSLPLEIIGASHCVTPGFVASMDFWLYN